MASFREKEGGDDSDPGELLVGDSYSLSLLADIRKLVEAERLKERLTYDELLVRLKRWWCWHYKRPYKDPLLESYTLEELYHEYYDIEHDRIKAPTREQVSEKVIEGDRDWAAEEEARELAEYEAAQKAKAEAAKAEAEGDTIVDESVGLTDEEWAAKHAPEEKQLVNPTADEVDTGGDISASFEK